MQFYEELIKEREELIVTIQNRKMEANALPRGTVERSAVLADLAALRIRYSVIQQEIIERFANRM